MSDDQGALFGPPPAGPRKPGPVEAALRAGLAAGFESGKLMDEDRTLAESALVLAATVDTAHRIGDLKGGYLAAQAQPALQKALHALRMPAELTPAAVLPSDSRTDLSGLLRDTFGTAE